MNIDDFLELCSSRRSVRSWQKKDIEETHIKKILEAARLAPSAGNSQPWEFIVIRDKETRHRIADICKKQAQWKFEMEKAVRGEIKHPGFAFRHAPVHILVLGDRRVCKAFPVRTLMDKEDSHFFSSLAISTVSMFYAAATLGIYGEWISDSASPYFAVMLKKLLGIPENLEVYHLIPMGYPNDYSPPRPRRPLEDIVHYEKYNIQKKRNDEDIDKFINEYSLRGNPAVYQRKS